VALATSHSDAEGTSGAVERAPFREEVQEAAPRQVGRKSHLSCKSVRFGDAVTATVSVSSFQARDGTGGRQRCPDQSGLGKCHRSERSPSMVVASCLWVVRCPWA